ncbi:O-succinylbenzoic acid-CoA ligase MenE or related acyl-CoA synthetase (AMP-forming) (MenE/FadK) (PDB:5EY9) (PUBMED:25151136 [Commensalibacter communis]|uniref:O-succinylbenzoic acid-CoA ligase MenE or related acyl-CoA synthetase (AMP-forming) (MenE/FadK) n=2 Tax=Commensalibacter communis TaxID=2972786 RepID=A0A9W4TN97_9PROT|nr:O-succinylbenzoic acid-CoA ligase MenE or related acyl-CoA synthetase (AMP-forming) (MenE/FadK) (PDB:5EY9) (PUBMED:25151136 [Commensalibacter communis]CAI3929197.1 O-succinylbenzoic acid-CoA ligase MenE or related acyl-CoA synthetase (AMP-forming) (MenE/FadK) (PDB:5EY9) (PUBMED:25151136 [Commensalibacter communis]CAI3932268.1 O-succinylbenzoic acid-CoA ligase MenE or related acyl-CoA synthetase (AMP-forming) (MenE/FadK) (PDB:5EY9) (PUBMED:25151136 [Commensalibacter communis]CAI3933807.1 O-suc
MGKVDAILFKEKEMLKGIKALYQIKLLSFNGLWYLINAIHAVGMNLMALLYVAQKLYPNRIAFQDDTDQITYRDLYLQSQRLADQLYQHYDIQPRQKIAVIAYNHLSLVHSLFALSVLGADIYLINAEISPTQFQRLNEKHQFKWIIHDPEIQYVSLDQSIFMDHHLSISINSLLKEKNYLLHQKRKVRHFSKIIVLTSGSTGNFKSAERSSKVGNFLIPFYQLLAQLNLYRYQSIYIATPIYHGFGMATLCMAVILGATSYLQKKFIAQDACDLLEKHQIEVVTLVPLMLSRMLRCDERKLRSLQCIITGGAAIAEPLVNETLSKLGNILFNLYGTSEAGVCMIATPNDLQKSPKTIGKPIPGLQAKIVENGQTMTDGVGELYIKCAWSIQSKIWIKTGDLAFKDLNGYYYLQGRADDMIVSGGENVYPYSLEQTLINHPMVAEAFVLVIFDSEFGQRLVAFIVVEKNQSISEEELYAWLKTKIARYQMPKRILLIDEIPITIIGKPDKKKLLQLLT